MTAGDNTVAPGTLAKAIYDQLNSEFGSPPSSEMDGQRKKMAAAVATAVVSHIQDNADVTITTADDGLQQVSGTDTDPPATKKTLSSAVD